MQHPLWHSLAGSRRLEQDDAGCFTTLRRDGRMSILLERESFLRTLEELFRQAVEGRGQVVLISGEAGIGKTSLVEGFLARHPSGMRSLWGACEALFTPRPLGPLYDIAAHAHGPLQTLLGG